MLWRPAVVSDDSRSASLIGTLRRSAPGQVKLFGIDVGS
jgi:hypothetical protein